MTTIPPVSTIYSSNTKKNNSSHLFQTPVFGKDSGFDVYQDEGITSSKKKVVFTSKVTEKIQNGTNIVQKTLFVKNDTDCCSTSSSTVRTISKNNSDGVQSKETRSYASTLASTPATVPRKADTQNSEIAPIVYGKRKIQYIGFDDDDDDEDYPYPENENENNKENIDPNKEVIVGATTTSTVTKTQTTVKKQTKQVKLTLEPPKTPIVTDLYLFNTTRTKMYRFPVFKDADLKVPDQWQNKLRDTDIDNDCETENDILEYSIIQVKKDLAKALQMQKEEDAYLKTQQKPVKYASCPQATSRRSEVPHSENTKKEEGVGFWKEVAQSFKDLVGNSGKRKST